MDNRWFKLLGGLLLLSQATLAQQYYEYLPDSVGRRLMRRAHVQRLTWLLEDTRYHTGPQLYREMAFDPKGRISASRNANDPTIYGSRYDEKGRRVASYSQTANAATNLTALDPARDQSRVRYVYDSQGRIIAELTERSGQQDTLKRHRVVMVADTTWEYELLPGGNTTASRTFLQENGRLFRYDFLTYRHPKNHPEAPQYLHELKSYYTRLDAQGRETESGSVDYQPGMEEWIGQRLEQQQPLPGGMQGFLYEGGMNQLLLRGTVPGRYVPSGWTHYNAQGQVTETWSAYGEGLRRYQYNTAGQLVEIQRFAQPAFDGTAGLPVGRVTVAWGATGLPVRIEQQDTNGQPVQISTYSYELFAEAADKPAAVRKRRKNR